MVLADIVPGLRNSLARLQEFAQPEFQTPTLRRPKSSSSIHGDVHGRQERLYINGKKFTLTTLRWCGQKWVFQHWQV